MIGYTDVTYCFCWGERGSWAPPKQFKIALNQLSSALPDATHTRIDTYYYDHQCCSELRSPASHGMQPSLLRAATNQSESISSRRRFSYQSGILPVVSVYLRRPLPSSGILIRLECAHGASGPLGRGRCGDFSVRLSGLSGVAEGAAGWRYPEIAANAIA